MNRMRRSDIFTVVAALLALAMAGCVTTTATTGSYVNGTAVASSSSSAPATAAPGTLEQQQVRQLQ